MKFLKSIMLVLALGNAEECEMSDSTLKTYECDFAEGHGLLTGSVKITQCANTVYFQGNVAGTADEFVDGNHGFHVHENGVIAPDCAATGTHFQATENLIHSVPEDNLEDRHTGALGNIVVSSGSATVDKTDDVVSLDSSSAAFIGDKAIVVHAAPDDGNPDRLQSSTGNAGAR